MDYYCPSCDYDCERLVDGYCEECHNERQSSLNQHNASYDFWQGLSDSQRDYYIKAAVNA